MRYVLLFLSVWCTPLAAQTTVEINGTIVPPSHGSVTGTWFYHAGDTQLLLLGHAAPSPRFRIDAVLSPNTEIKIRDENEVYFTFRAGNEPKTVEATTELPLEPRRRPWSLDPVASSPDFHPAIETALIEHDWRMQDGIDTPREPKTHRQAIERLIPQTEKLLDDLERRNVDVDALSKRFLEIKKRTEYDGPHWLSLHRLRREIVLANPLFHTGPLVFVKQVPSTMSHQLTQVYGYTVRPGGGLLGLGNAARKLRTRDGARPLRRPGQFTRQAP